MKIGEALYNLSSAMKKAGVEGRMVLYLEKTIDGSYFLSAFHKEVTISIRTVEPEIDHEYESVHYYGVKIRWPKHDR